MNKALSFIGLDYRLLKPYSSSVLLLVALGVGMGYFFKSANTLASYFMMSLMLMMSYPFAITEKNGLDMLYGTLSLDRKTVVTGRYLFALTLELLCGVSAIVFAWLLSKVIGAPFVLEEIIVTLCILSGIFSFIVAVQFPIYFKLGYSKAKFMALIPMAIIFPVAVKLKDIAKLFNLDISWDNLSTILEENYVAVSLAPVIIGLMLILLSSLLSRAIYAGKDM